MSETRLDGVPADLARLGRPVNLRLTALSLDNFKSFKTKTRIPLRDGFSTISGPNGSGKSNLIDALQFVMGLATSKSMRAGALGDLVCTDGNKPSARVALELEGTFDGPHGRLVQRQVELARVVRRKRSGTTAHYELDGAPIRLADLHELLRGWGFPTSGQNIVLQGDVVRITSMGATARRQVLDELAGAKEFDRRIGQAHEELEAADRCTEDTKLILKELAQRLGQLKKERDQALAFQSLSQRKASLEDDLVVLEVTEAELKVQNEEKARDEAEKARGKLEKRKEELAKASQARQADLQALEKELSEKGEGERLSAVRGVESLRARLEGARQEVERVRGEGAELERRLPGLREGVAQAEARLADLGQQGQTLDQRLKAKETEHQVLAGKSEAVNESLRKQSAAQIEAAQQGQRLRLTVEELHARERTLAARERELAEVTSRGEAERSHLTQAVEGATARKAELGEQARVASERFRTQRAQVAEATERRRRLLSQLQDLRSGLEATASKVGRAERELAAAEARAQAASSLSGGQALDFLRKQGLRGLHGPVADLVRFDTKHAQALEAAAGGRLHWVVVDDEHVAREAIDMLKRGRAGRLSFAPLTKMRGPRIDAAAPRGQRIVGYALDLVEAERRYDEVLRSVFGSTLVVEELRDGLPLIGRYRMVTLDGDILEKGGLMTGGAATKAGRILVAAARALEEVEERKKTLFELEKQHSAARGALRRVEAEYEEAGEALSRLQAALAEAEATAASLNGELGRLEAELGPRAARLEALAAEVEEARAEQAEVQAQVQAVRAELEDESDRIHSLDAPGDASKEFEELTAKARQYEAALRALEGELGKLRAEHAELQGERRAAEERLEGARKALAEAEAAQATLGRRAAEAAVGTIQAELAEKEAALAELSSELMALTERRDQARQAAEAARDALQQATLELKGLADRVGELAHRIEDLRQAAADLRAAAEEREIEVPPLEEAPPDLARSRKRIEQDLTKVTAELDRMGPVNQLAIEQYDDATTRHEELEGKVEKLEQEKTEIRARIVDLEGKKKTAFLDAFGLVSEAFAHSFAELARGEGRLRLEEPKDPFSGGLIIEARPRGKKLTRLEAMSGGEKTLTALAFIFALQEVNPAPFFVFDEVDAALDGVNTEVVAEAVRRRSSDRQYVVISHRRVMLEKSHQTLGVTMRKGYGTWVTGVPMDDEPAAEPEVAEVAS